MLPNKSVNLPSQIYDTVSIGEAISDVLPCLTVVTPLFDPSGSALPYFERCAESVRSQVDVDIQWIISVQSVDDQYEPLLRSLVDEGVVSELKYSRATRLSKHLEEILNSVNNSSVHILCQDDFYLNTRSAAWIAESLSHFPFIMIKPRGIRSVNSLQICMESGLGRGPKLVALGAWLSSLERIGINHFGGLSTVAFDSRLYISGIFTHDLMVDLELRSQLTRLLGAPKVLRGAVVAESIWLGQSQNLLLDRFDPEVKAWAISHRTGKAFDLWATIVSESLRQKELSKAWANKFPRALGILARCIGFAFTPLCYAEIRLSRWTRQVVTKGSH